MRFAAPASWPVSQELNFTDRVFIVFFFLLSISVLMRSCRVPGWPTVVSINLICFTVVMLLARQASRSRVWRFLHDWYPLAMFIVCFEEVSRLSFLFVDSWRDHYLLTLEARIFSMPPTVWLGRHTSPLLTEMLEAGYFSYFVLLMIVGGVFQWRQDRKAFRLVMDATVLAYVACYVVFLLFPTEGPAHTLAAQHSLPIVGGGPFHWVVQFIQRTAGVHGNAFPSAHVAGGVVSLVFAWRFVPRLGHVLTPFVILLCICAVYDRYHYLSGVLAGIVFGILASAVVLRFENQPYFPKAESRPQHR